MLRRRLRWLCALGLEFERGKEIEGIGGRMYWAVEWVKGRDVAQGLPFLRRYYGDGGRMDEEAEVMGGRCILVLMKKSCYVACGK